MTEDKVIRIKLDFIYRVLFLLPMLLLDFWFINVLFFKDYGKVDDFSNLEIAFALGLSPVWLFVLVILTPLFIFSWTGTTISALGLRTPTPLGGKSYKWQDLGVFHVSEMHVNNSIHYVLCAYFRNRENFLQGSKQEIEYHHQFCDVKFSLGMTKSLNSRANADSIRRRLNRYIEVNGIGPSMVMKPVFRDPNFASNKMLGSAFGLALAIPVMLGGALAIGYAVKVLQYSEHTVPFLYSLRHLVLSVFSFF